MWYSPSRQHHTKRVLAPELAGTHESIILSKTPSAGKGAAFSIEKVEAFSGKAYTFSAESLSLFPAVHKGG